jgi:hypothetical protein
MAVSPGIRSATASLDLLPTKDLAAQLTNTEWLESFPGPDTQKRVLLECMSCHTLERIARSHFDATAFVPVLQRMQGYANNSTPLHPQLRVVPQHPDPTRLAQAAAYLATVTLSAAPAWSYALKTLPRPTGRATRVVIIEYRMPGPDIAPHDVYRDADGRIWFSEFSEQKLGMLDPATGEVTEYPIPLLKPGSPVGTLDLEPGPNGTLWLALMFQGGVAKFDIASKTLGPGPGSGLVTTTTQQSSRSRRRNRWSRRRFARPLQRGGRAGTMSGLSS